MAPLSLLPEWLQTLAAILPFRWMLAFPTELLLGRLTPTEVIWGAVTQVMWLGLSWGILAVVWSRGVRRYSAVGS